MRVALRALDQQVVLWPYTHIEVSYGMMSSELMLRIVLAGWFEKMVHGPAIFDAIRHALPILLFFY
jgi:hypothetical protein